MTIHNNFNFLLTYPPVAMIVGKFIINAFDLRIKWTNIVILISTCLPSAIHYIHVMLVAGGKLVR